MAKPALGRGLGALLGGAQPAPKTLSPTPENATSTPASSAAHDARERIEQVVLSRIRPCPFQPRKEFPEAALQELADSIKERGIVQPLVVRPQGDHYELIAGERRWRAAQLAGLDQVPVVVRQADDRAVLELALIENLQRENLNPLEEAQGYQQLVEQFGLRQEEVAIKVGKSRVAVTNALRLLKLTPGVQAHLRTGQLSVGHAKVLLALSHPEEQRLAAERILRDGLNVRQTEHLVARLLNRSAEPPPPATATPPKPPGAKDVHAAALESRLQERLATKVSLRYRHGKGAIEIRFYSDAELERILELVGVQVD
ncbi:MAG: ParB/RepB/Spo0J family partition protein [Verrucomicrobia bacterium]|nr:ParB/RepB/Spo0J family partition protein [Verrucomicrobiota bacterium]